MKTWSPFLKKSGSTIRETGSPVREPGSPVREKRVEVKNENSPDMVSIIKSNELISENLTLNSLIFKKSLLYQLITSKRAAVNKNIQLF